MTRNLNWFLFHYYRFRTWKQLSVEVNYHHRNNKIRLMVLTLCWGHNGVMRARESLLIVSVRCVAFFLLRLVVVVIVVVGNTLSLCACACACVRHVTILNSF